MPQQELTGQSASVLFAAFSAMVFGAMTLAGVALSVFMQSISAERGWDRASIGSAAMFLYIGMAVIAPVMGVAVDRYGARQVLLPVTMISGLILMSFSILPASLVMFLGAHFFLGVSQSGPLALNKMISNWFWLRRGLALAAVGVGLFFGQLLAPPVARELLLGIGWQNAYFVFGACEVFIALPILFFFFKEPQGAIDRKLAPGLSGSPDGLEDVRRYVLRDALVRREFWLLLGAVGTSGWAYMTLNIHGVGILTEHGVSASRAVWGLSTFATGAMIAQLVSGWLLDVFDTPKIMMPFAVLSMAAAILLQAGSGGLTPLIAFLLLGVSLGAQTSMTSYFTTRYFGVKDFSRIYGILFPLILVLMAPAPAIVGHMFDMTHSYTSALYLTEAVCLIAALLFLALPVYRYSKDRGQAQ